MNSIEKYSEQIFENIKHVNEYGQEFWYARDLQVALEYKRWDRFNDVLDRAISACRESGNSIEDHFSHVGKMVNLGSGSQREVDDYMLSRYACYLIVIHAHQDPGRIEKF